MAVDVLEPPVPRRRIALLLAGAAGYLDAVSYLMLGIFTANMTGNTVLLGIALGQAHWAGAGRVALALASFIAGAAAGALVLRRQRRIGSVLAAEAAILLAALGIWAALPRRGASVGPAAVPFITLLSAAMGAQTAAVRRVGEQRVSTTYVTGTLTSLAIEAATALLTRPERGPRGDADGGARPAGSGLLLGGLWLAYVAGALVGGFSELRWAFLAVVAPVAVLGAVIGWDLARAPRA